MFIRLKTFPAWVFLSVAANGLLMLAITLLLLRDQWTIPSSQASAPTTQLSPIDQKSVTVPEIGQRHQLSYQQWVNLLGREAKVAATHQSKHLTILAGDSLSLWFPTELLPTERVWLNQGISGETSAGLLKRLALFDQTQPDVVFVMIGINDLLRGVKDETILANQQQILRYLRQAHPQAQIVVQSILPHCGAKSTWEGRDRLLKIPNQHIQEINRQLAVIAQTEGVLYLDLHPLFTDAQGNLRSDLSTDGLHLSSQGYLVWRSALQLFSQLKLPQTPVELSQNKSFKP